MASDSTLQLISTALAMISNYERLKVLLHIIKTITSSLAKSKQRPYQDKSKFGRHCRIQYSPATSHEPYFAKPSYSQRQRDTHLTTEGFDTRHKKSQAMRNKYPHLLLCSQWTMWLILFS